MTTPNLPAMAPTPLATNVKASDKLAAAENLLRKHLTYVTDSESVVDRYATYAGAAHAAWDNWTKAKKDETELGVKWKVVAMEIDNRFHDIGGFDDSGFPRASDDPKRLREIERRAPKRVEAKAESVLGAAPAPVLTRAQSDAAYANDMVERATAWAAATTAIVTREDDVQRTGEAFAHAKVALVEAKRERDRLFEAMIVTNPPATTTETTSERAEPAPTA